MELEHYNRNPVGTGFGNVFGGCMGFLLAVGIVIVLMFVGCGGCFIFHTPTPIPTTQGTFR